MSTDLGRAERMMRQEAALWSSWHRCLQGSSGQSYGVEVRELDGAVLLMVQGVPVTHYNRLVVTGSPQRDVIESSARFFAERFTPFRVDLSAPASTPRLMGTVEGLGFCVSEVQVSLSGPPRARPRKRPKGVFVRKVRGAEVEFFARLYEHAYFGQRQPAGLSKLRVESVRSRFHDPQWHFYMSFVDGIPAGGGALFVHEGIATVSGGATLYTLRGRGAQLALLDERLAAAAVLGCREVLGRCRVGGSSQRNMERVGLRPRFTKSVYEQRWQPLRTPAPADQTASGRGRSPKSFSAGTGRLT